MIKTIKHKDKKNHVFIKSIFYGFISVFTAVGLFFAIMFVCFPKNAGDFCLNMGAKNTAMQMYYKQYEKTNEINYLYKCVNLSIVTLDYENNIEFFKEFQNHEDYSSYLQYKNNQYLSSNISIREKSKLLFEKNYLLENYVFSLIKCGYNLDAIDLASDLSSENLSLTSISNYLYSSIVNAYSTKAEFSSVFNNTVIDNITNYFNTLYDIYVTNNVNNISINNSTYLLAVANRIIKVGTNIVEINNKLENITSNEILSKIEYINNSISSIWG